MKNKSRFLATLMSGTMIFTLTPLQLASAATTSTISATSAILHPQRIEPYRPQYHFSPQKNWMNDPNGMVYYDGEYHLFFQYHPYGDTWGPMHWGHAISKNLVDWDEYPIGIFQDTEGMIFSGSTVVDWNNTSGLQTGTEKVMVAMFTQLTPNNTQEQGIAYSNDKGRTWIKYAGNPVLPNVSPDFRDPKMFWHEQTKQWVMILSQGSKVTIYNSPNLKQWTKVSEFGEGQGSQGRPLECPDLFPLSVDGGVTQKWVMVVSVQSAAPAGGSGAQYFIGDFDGKNFTNSNPASKILWLDYGKDNYAGVSFSDMPTSDGRRIYMGWMSNWEYAQGAPTSPWRSSNTVPRGLQLKTFSDGIRLVQTPVTELQALRQPGTTLPTQTITPGTNPLSNLSGKQYEVVAEFNVDGSCTASEFGFKIRKGGSNYTKLYYNKSTSEMGVDRSASGTFASGIQKAPLAPQNGTIKMRFLVDWSSVELFGNDGRETITDQIFTDAANQGIELYSQGGNVTLNSLEYYPLNSASIGKYEPQVNWPNGSFTNHDFETGDLTGWTTIGDAFNVNDVTDLMTPKGGSGDSFGDKEGKYHVWGFKDGLDATVGEMRSNPFVLEGDGKIDFRIGGGVDIDNLYVALVRRSDDKELLKATANKLLNPSTNQLEISEKLQKVTLDASQYIGQECYIKVVDKVAGGWGHINVDDFNVPTGVVSVLPPRNLAGSVTQDSKVALTWNAPETGVGVKEYKILRNGTEIATTQDTSYTDTSIEKGVEYIYSVKSVSDTGDVSSSSNAITITVPTGTVSVLPPRNLAGSVTQDSKVALTWNAPETGAGVREYKILRNGTEIATTQDTSYTDTSIEKGVAYIYSVKSVSDTGDVSSPSNAITITVSDGNDMEKPSIPGKPVSSGVTTNSISLTWTESTDNVGVKAYKILRNNVEVGNTITASFTDTGLTPNTEYTYTIAAYDAAGNTSDSSTALIVKTMPTIPTQVTSFTNHDFETGDLTGWTIKSGDAFSSRDVTSDTNWGWGGPFNQQGTYHLWSFKDGGDGQVGEIWTAKNFIIGGNGKIDFLVSGGNDINNLYVALVRNSDGRELFKSTGNNNEAYNKVNWDASSYIGEECYIKVVDKSTGGFGHINIDDINVSISVEKDRQEKPTTIINHDFETGDLTGWTIESGDAFSSKDVASDTNWGWGGPFNQQGTYHLWSFKDGGDGQIGVLKSSSFTLTNRGSVDFLISGGNDISNLYVALVRKSDGQELFKATGDNNEAYRRVTWDTSAYIGTECYIKVVDKSTGGFGHINIDDVNV